LWARSSRNTASEDALQDAYVRDFLAFDTFASAEARAWLLAIVRNVAHTALANRRRTRNLYIE